MDDAVDTVLGRLARIDALRAAGAPPRELLPELHALLEEGRAWLAVEPEPAPGAESALAALEGRLERRDLRPGVETRAAGSEEVGRRMPLG